MASGAYTIRLLSCQRCRAYLGWEIVRAHEETERWKEGRALLELECLRQSGGLDEGSVSDAVGTWREHGVEIRVRRGAALRDWMVHGIES